MEFHTTVAQCQALSLLLRLSQMTIQYITIPENPNDDLKLKHRETDVLTFLKWFLCDSLYLMANLLEPHNPGTSSERFQSWCLGVRWLSALAVRPPKTDLRQEKWQHTWPRRFGSHAEKHSTRLPLSRDVGELRWSRQEGAMMADATTGTSRGAGGT